MKINNEICFICDYYLNCSWATDPDAPAPLNYTYKEDLKKDNEDFIKYLLPYIENIIWYRLEEPCENAGKYFGEKMRIVETITNLSNSVKEFNDLYMQHIKDILNFGEKDEESDLNMLDIRFKKKLLKLLEIINEIKYFEKLLSHDYNVYLLFKKDLKQLLYLVKTNIENNLKKFEKKNVLFNNAISSKNTI